MACCCRNSRHTAQVGLLPIVSDCRRPPAWIDPRCSATSGCCWMRPHSVDCASLKRVREGATEGNHAGKVVVTAWIGPVAGATQEGIGIRGMGIGRAWEHAQGVKYRVAGARVSTPYSPHEQPGSREAPATAPPGSAAPAERAGLLRHPSMHDAHGPGRTQRDRSASWRNLVSHPRQLHE